MDVHKILIDTDILYWKYWLLIDFGSHFGKYLGLKCTFELNQGQAIMKKYKLFAVAAQEAEI